MGLFSKIKEGLKKTRNAVMGQIDSMLKSFTKIDEELLKNSKSFWLWETSVFRPLRRFVMN